MQLVDKILAVQRMLHILVYMCILLLGKTFRYKITLCKVKII